MLDLLISIDDTDNLESIGTGKLASFLAGELERTCGAACSLVTRHQLYVHDEIPYTSHNSSMCFAARVPSDGYRRVIDAGASFLRGNSAPGSDPGLCVVSLRDGLDAQALIGFGRRAKQLILDKGTAYANARSLGVHLSEHGGTGDGIVGALAGAGLRLSGNDGRYRGWTSFETPNDLIRVGDLCSRGGVDAVQTVDGDDLPDNEVIRLVNRVKYVLLNGRCVVLVERNPEPSVPATWKVVPKQSLGAY
jgi:hypothetical protein